MAVTSPPITTLIATGQTISVANPLRPAAGQSWEVLIDNQTQFVLEVVASGVKAWLQPLMSAVYQSTGPGEVTITAGASAFSVATPLIYTQWAQFPDRVTTPNASGNSISPAPDVLSLSMDCSNGVNTLLPAVPNVKYLLHGITMSLRSLGNSPALNFAFGLLASDVKAIGQYIFTDAPERNPVHIPLYRTPTADYNKSLIMTVVSPGGTDISVSLQYELVRIR